VVAALGLSTPSRALIVFDPSNFAQNSLTAAHTLQEINNQVVELQNEAQMLLNEARNLTSLPFNIVPQLQAALASTTQLIQQAQGLAWQLGQVRMQFAQLYPQFYTANITGTMMAQDAMQRWGFSLQALGTSVSMQAQAAQNLTVDENSLATLVAQSQGAVGILEAAQATNQLLALQSRQAIQEQQLKLTQDRSAAAELARTVAAEARSREVRRRFVITGGPYTPQPIDLYGY
jgi:P-type conjugative transfer protein TrbJ